MVSISTSSYGRTVMAPASMATPHMIVQSVSKEDRAAGKKGAIVGNLRPMESKGEVKSKPVFKQEDSTEDIPF